MFLVLAQPFFLACASHDCVGSGKLSQGLPAAADDPAGMKQRAKQVRASRRSRSTRDLLGRSSLLMYIHDPMRRCVNAVGLQRQLAGGSKPVANVGLQHERNAWL